MACWVFSCWVARFRAECEGMERCISDKTEEEKCVLRVGMQLIKKKKMVGEDEVTDTALEI